MRLTSVFISALAARACQAASGNLTVAMIRAPPPNWPLPILNLNWTGIVLNISQTVDAGVKLIQQAADEGADFVTFPELWFPGFPKGRELNNWSHEFLPKYIENSIAVGDVNWKRLTAAIVKAGIYTQLNFAEKTDEHLFMAQALISPVGDVLIQRRKLRPSGSEREMFTDGTIGEIIAVTTSFGRVGILECGEHWNPSMTFPLQAQAENFHLGPFPYILDADNKEAAWWEGAVVEMGVMGHYANLANAYTFTAAIGASFVMSPLAQLGGYISHKVDFTEQPIFYHKISTAGFNSAKTYDSDSQVSWGVLQQILKGFPTYIPRVEGNLVPYRSNNITDLASGNYVIGQE